MLWTAVPATYLLAKNRIRARPAASGRTERHHLKLLRPLVGGPLKRGGAEQPQVIGQMHRPHKVVNEPGGGRPASGAILQRHDDVEVVLDLGHASATSQTLQGLLDRLRRQTALVDRLGTEKRVASVRLQRIDPVFKRPSGHQGSHSISA